MHWAGRRHPQRLPATYTRYHGVRHLLAFFDVYRDQFWGYFFQRKRWQETLRAFKRLRKRYPRQIRIYLILDNFSPHKRPEIRRWARENNVCLVWTPTNASWLNRIECQFTEIRKFSLDNTYYKTHRQLQRAVRRFIRYRNKRQRNKPKKHTTLIYRPGTRKNLVPPVGTGCARFCYFLLQTNSPLPMGTVKQSNRPSLSTFSSIGFIASW